jgi:hypothetical protein
MRNIINISMRREYAQNGLDRTFNKWKNYYYGTKFAISTSSTCNSDVVKVTAKVYNFVRSK